jgi:serine/threonine protein phosphatase PrpC
MRKLGGMLSEAARGFCGSMTGALSTNAAPVIDNSPPRQNATLHPRLCAITDSGVVRRSNEDTFRVAPEQDAFFVADGMGGEQSGEVASFIAAEAFTDLRAQIRSAPELLRCVFDQAQRRVLERSKTEAKCAGMGAAVVVAALDGDLLYVGHLGDARAYLSHGDGLVRLTSDHSTIARAVLRGDLSWEEARLHPGRSTLYKAIGFEGQTPPDFSSVRVTPGDRLLLCSDGLWDELPDSEIKDVLTSEGTVCELAHILLNRALAAGGHDNITLVLYEHSAAGRNGLPDT